MPPVGTQVILEHQKDRLLIEIPPCGMRGLPRFFLIFFGSCLVYGLLSLFAIHLTVGVTQINLFLLLVFILFTGISWLMFLTGIYEAGIRFTLCITPEHFWLGRELWGLKFVYSNPSHYIYPVCLEEIRLMRKRITVIAIHEVGKRHVLGTWLSDEEKSWLLKAIINYLSLQTFSVNQQNQI